MVVRCRRPHRRSFVGWPALFADRLRAPLRSARLLGRLVSQPFEYYALSHQVLGEYHAAAWRSLLLPGRGGGGRPTSAATSEHAAGTRSSTLLHRRQGQSPPSGTRTAPTRLFVCLCTTHGQRHRCLPLRWLHARAAHQEGYASDLLRRSPSMHVMCLAPAFDPSECWPRVCCLRSCVQPQLQHTRPARTILRRVESDRRRRRCGLPQVPYGDAGHEDAAQPAGLERVAGSRSDEQSHRHGNLGAARRGQQRCGRSQWRRPPGPVMV